MDRSLLVQSSYPQNCVQLLTKRSPSAPPSGAAWETVTRARNFAAHVPADIANPQMELVILLPQAQAGGSL